MAGVIPTAGDVPPTRARRSCSDFGANWESTEGIDRARHAMASFFKNYLRGVVPRLVMAFNALKGYKRVLRLEEALRL